MKRLLGDLWRPHRWLLGTDALWAVIVLAAILFLTSLVPLPPHDVWWHLKIGELIFESGSIPTTNMFAWTLPADESFVYAAWLGELLLYVVYRLGDLALLTCVRTLIILATFCLVAVEARRRSGSWRIAAFVLAIAALSSLNNLIVRPQIWSFVPFMLVMILLERFADGELRGRWLVICPLLMIFWANAHGAFVLGVVLGGAYTVGTLVSALGKRTERGWWQKPAWLGGTTAAMGLGTLVNPRGLAIVDYVRDLMTDPPSQGLVMEWQSPTPNGIANVAFFASILLLLLVFAHARCAPKPAHMLLLLGFLWLAWSGQRYVIWFALVSAPILAEAIAGLGLPFLSAPSQRNWLNTFLACLLFVPAIAVQPWWVERVPLPEAYWSQVHRDTDAGSLLDTSTPVGAVEYLRQHPGGKLFNEMGYGSYLIWALPEQGVFVDPRVELYPYEQWLDYIRIGRGVRYNELLDAYGADRVLLSITLQEELAGCLKADPRWEMEYEDAYSQIWRRVER